MMGSGTPDNQQGLADSTEATPGTSKGHTSKFY